MIELKNINFKYKNGINVLENIELQIESGEIISIIGKNGEGKSTLVKILAGLLKPTSGNVLVDGLNIYERKNRRYSRKNIAIVFQNPDNQILFDNVYDDMEFALKNLEIENSEEKIKESLKKVGMTEYINANTYNLSLGQKQRINIASALARNPNYLILDEPTTMIDSAGKEKIYEIIKTLKKENKTIIYVTNNMKEILFSDKIVILEQHKIKEIIERKNLLENIEKIKKADIILPDILKILLELRNKGLKINIYDYTAEELANKIISEVRK